MYSDIHIMTHRINIGADSKRLSKFSNGRESFLDLNPPNRDDNHIDLNKKKIIASGPTWLIFVTRIYVPKFVAKLQVRTL